MPEDSNNLNWGKNEGAKCPFFFVFFSQNWLTNCRKIHRINPSNVDKRKFDMTTNTIEVWKNKEDNYWVVENGSDFAIWPTQKEAVKDARLKMWIQDDPSKWQILIARAKDNVVAYHEFVGLNSRGWRMIKRFKVSNPFKITEQVLGAH